MTAPQNRFAGEFVYETEADLDLVIADGKPRMLRADEDPNDRPVVRPPGSICQDTSTPALWLATVVPGVWQQAIGLTPITPDTTILTPVGMIKFSLPSQDEITDAPVLEDIEIIDGWAIKTDEEGDGDDKVSVFFLRPAIPQIAAIFDLAPCLLGGKIYQGAGTGSDNPGNNWVFGHDGNNHVGSAVVANTWTHVALTYDSGAKKIYLNGQLDNETTASMNAAGTGDIAIGAALGVTEYFPGWVDEAAIFNHSLTPERLLPNIAACWES